MLATSVTEVHKLPFHSYMASGTDIVTVSVGKEHDLRYGYFHTVASKDDEKVGKDSRGKGCLRLSFRSPPFFSARSHHSSSPGNKSANPQE